LLVPAIKQNNDTVSLLREQWPHLTNTLVNERTPRIRCSFFCFARCGEVKRLPSCVFSNQSLFGNKPAGFGATTTSTPSFGTGTSLFGNKPALTLGTGTNTSAFGKPCFISDFGSYGVTSVGSDRGLPRFQ